MQWIKTIIDYLFSFFAVYQAWTCNRYEYMIVRLIICLVAFRFTKYYMLYYTIFHWILRYPCANAFGSGFLKK